MSAKETAIEAIQHLPDSATWNGIVTALQEAKATQDALRRFDERGGIPDEDVTDDEWRAMICHQLVDDLDDPRQNIYSLEHEGKPEYEPR